MNGRMQISSVMADDVTTAADLEPGAPVPRDYKDDELIALSKTLRKRGGPKIGVITAAGVVFLCALFLYRLNSDRRFGGNAESPRQVAVTEILGGNVDRDAYVSVQAEPLMAHAVRVAVSKNGVGLRMVPARGTNEKLWLVLSGDGWAQPSKGSYIGRLRELSDLPFADVAKSYVAAHPQPLFAPASAVRAGFATGTVTTVDGQQVTLKDTDRVGFEVIDPNGAVILAAFNEKHPDVTAWRKALADAGIPTTGTPTETREQVRFDVATPNAVSTTSTKLETAGLWAARVDPVTHHYDTTWAALKASGPAGFTAGNATVPDAQLDLIGVYVVRGIPSGAYALILEEHPQDYWYVLPVTIVVALIGLVFLWALVRAVKRDLLPANK